VAPGYQACGEGTFFAGDDVKGTITLASPLIEMKVTAINPWTGPPQATVYVNGWGCLDDQFWKDGDKDVWDDGVLLYTVQRLADGQWKEFTVTLAESEKPSESGLPTHCVPDSGTGFS
jgi:hypothetical protein